MAFTLIAAGIFVVCCGATWAFIKACSDVTHSMFEERDDHELALSAEGARRREADARRQAGGAMPAVPARERGPRDPAIGVDQARAEVRERIRRYNQREVRR